MGEGPTALDDAPPQVFSEEVLRTTARRIAKDSGPHPVVEVTMRARISTFIPLLLLACGAPPPDLGTSPEPHFRLSQQQLRGEAIYEGVCWACHGHGGHGDGPVATYAGETPPPTFHTQDFAGRSSSALLALFQAGLDLNDPEAHHHGPFVMDLLESVHLADALAYVSALAYPPEIPGSALGGSELYDQYCVACHGLEGRGDGPVASFLSGFEPSDLTTDSLVARRSWDTLFERMKIGFGTAHGSKMPPWDLVLTDAELWDLVAYMATMQPEQLSAPFPSG
jgi:mono/diheme cytochrome c family protein